MSARRGSFVLSILSALLLGSVLAVHVAGQTRPKDTYVLKGGPLGGVKLEHKVHAEGRGIKCETCHHPSKPQKPLVAPQQSCGTCHTMPATPPMKTNLMLAFHNPTAMVGTCIDCHKTENAKGKGSPVKCVDCHKKSNI